jgi:periplasmic protein TonB
MTGLAPEPEERIRPHASFGNGRRGFGWAAVASLLFHGTALAAVLIAAAGEGPQLPLPAVEVSVVVSPAPAGAAASAAEKAQDAPEPEPVANPPESEGDPLAELTVVSPPVADSEPVQPEPRPVAAVEMAPAPAPPPPPPRKPSPPEESPAHSQPAASDAPPERGPAPSAPPAQLAALPAGDPVDSAAALGAGTSEPPRYEAGGEANPWPRYPAAARRRGIEGEVLVEVRVGADGAPAGVEILRSSGSALLDAAAVEALERWRFEPARSGGQPVAGTVEIPVTFKLTEPGGS